MAEFKFSCPQCGQHIQCETGYCGCQINCPACQQTIVVPQAPPTAAPPAAPPPPPAALVPPPPPAGAPGLATRLSTTVPAAGRRFAGAPPPGKKSGALKPILIAVTALVGAALGFFGVQYFMGNIHLGHSKTPKPNPAAQVAPPTPVATASAVNILDKARAAYTNLNSVTADSTITLFLDLSNITTADVSLTPPANPKIASQHPRGMPKILTNSTQVSFKQVKSNMYYLYAGEAVTKADRQTSTNTFAVWSADKGAFSFSDSHVRGLPPTYMQIQDAGTASAQAEQYQRIQQLFTDPAQATKIIKNLGQTADEPVNGQDCYTLTAKVVGQKVKIWVDKSTYIILQTQITLGGAVSDADIDDAFSFVADGFTNVPPAALEMVKPQVKHFAPVLTKVRGVITATTQNVIANPALSADDFSYNVPPGVRLTRIPGAGTGATPTARNGTAAAQMQQRNACINNLRQIDAAINQWALEKGKTNGTVVTEADIKPYIKLDASGNLPKCPAGGTYTLGKVGGHPTCTVLGHVLP